MTGRVDIRLMHHVSRFAAVLLSFSVLSACADTAASQSSASVKATTTTTLTATTTTTTSEFLENLVAAAASGGNRATFDPGQSECLVRGIYDAVGESRLVEIGFSADGREGVRILEGDVGFTFDEREAIAAVYDGCVEDVLLVILRSGGEPDPAFADCYYRELQAREITVEQALFSAAGDNLSVVGPAFTEAERICEPAEE